MRFLAFKFLLFKFLILLVFYPTECLSCDKYLNTPEEFRGYVQTDLINAINSNVRSLKSIVEGKKGPSCWKVYSDRADNQLKTSPAGRNNDNNLGFMEMVVVKEVEERNGSAWLLVFSRLSSSSTEVKRHEKRGWIKANKVILSNYALLNDQSIPSKCMTLFSISSQNETLAPEEIDYNFYNKPSSTNNYKIGNVNTFKIYYILKETQRFVFVSKTDKLEAENEEGNVLGWMKKRKITNWDHRVCLEPNYGRKVKAKFENNEAYERFKLPVFYRNRELSYFLNQSHIRPDAIYQQYTIREERLDPIHFRRMPILENLSNTKKRVVTINKLNESEEEEDLKTEVRTELQELKKRRRQVNILFVVDATESMTEYYPAIRESMIETINNHQNLTESRTRLRFGLALYRDYPDGQEKFDLTPLEAVPSETVKNALKTVETQSQDEDLPEAQYQGLVKGIERCGFDKENSNIVVLVGDAGNHQPDPNDYSKEDVISTLNEYNASLISFQVVNGSAFTYTTFNSDAQDFLRKTAENYVPQNNDVKLDKIEKSVENTWRIKYPNLSKGRKGLAMFGRFTYASGEEPMPPEDLQENIVVATQNYLDTIESGINYLSGFEEGSVNVKPVDEKILKKLDWSDEEIEKLKELGGQFTMRGSLKTNYYNLNHPAFNPVVFLSYTEKERIDKILKKLVYDDPPPSEAKKALQNALLEQCKKMLGEEREAPILNKTMNEIWQIILGVPFQGSTYIANKKLREISTLSDDDFQTFYHNFKEDAKRFITKDFQDSEFQLADQTYYWIPLNEIPGNG